MKVLVIGGTGLISGPVVSALQERGAEVTIFHRNRLPVDLRGKTLEIIGDRSDRETFGGLVRMAGAWDCIIDMIGGTPEDAAGLIEAAQDVTPQVIFCSTTTVYRRPFRSLPVNEEADCSPPSPYGENKLAAERMLWRMAERGNFHLTVFRPAHIYDHRSLPLHVLGTRTSHLDRIRCGRPILVPDDGDVRWSSLWADDCAVAIAAAAGNCRAYGKTYNLAGAERFSWGGYQELCAKSLGVAVPELVPISMESLASLAPERSAQCRRTLRFGGDYDCTAAERDLGFRPKVCILEGLKRNIRFLLENKQIEPWENDQQYEDIMARCIKF
ncbi:N/A [soil metagenome]